MDRSTEWACGYLSTTYWSWCFHRPIARGRLNRHNEIEVSNEKLVSWDPQANRRWGKILEMLHTKTIWPRVDVLLPSISSKYWTGLIKILAIICSLNVRDVFCVHWHGINSNKEFVCCWTRKPMPLPWTWVTEENWEKRSENLSFNSTWEIYLWKMALSML